MNFEKCASFGYSASTKGWHDGLQWRFWKSPISSKISPKPFGRHGSRFRYAKSTDMFRAFHALIIISACSGQIFLKKSGFTYHTVWKYFPCLPWRMSPCVPCDQISIIGFILLINILNVKCISGEELVEEQDNRNVTGKYILDERNTSSSGHVTRSGMRCRGREA